MTQSGVDSPLAQCPSATSLRPLALTLQLCVVADNDDNDDSNAPLVEDAVACTWSALGRLGRLAGRGLERVAVDFVVSDCDGVTGQASKLIKSI